MATLKDVAKLAGVSYNTVSFVVNGIDKVAPSTKEKVIRAIKQLNYVPNKTARALISGRADAIAFVSAMFTSEAAVSILRELEEGIHLAGHQYDYDLIPYSTRSNSEALYRITGSIADSRKADVIIMLGIRPSPEEIRRLSEKKIGLILIDQRDSNACSINADNKKGAYMAADYIINKGRKNIAYIGGSGIKEGGLALGNRRQGFFKALEQKGMTPGAGLIREAADLSISEGYVLMKEMLGSGRKIDGLFCAAGDSTALGAMKAVKDHGLKIPDDISVIGYGDIPAASVSEPGLTTVKEPYEKIGNEAFGAALEMIKTRKIIKRDLVFEPVLIERGSG